MGNSKSCTRTGSGWPFARSSRPGLLKSPTNSFFLVSTEMAGWSTAIAACTVALMCRLLSDRALALATRASDPRADRIAPAPELHNRPPDGAARQTGRREQPPATPVQELAGLLIPRADVVDLNHSSSLPQRGRELSASFGSDPASSHPIRFSYFTSNPEHEASSPAPNPRRLKGAPGQTTSPAHASSLRIKEISQPDTRPVSEGPVRCI